MRRLEDELDGPPDVEGTPVTNPDLKADGKAAQEEARKKIPAWIRGEIELEFQEALNNMRVFIEDLTDGKTTEKKRKDAEKLIWGFLDRTAEPFCCGGVGYLLFGNGIPIAVTRDGQDFNRLLIYLGIHPGSPMRDRIGKFIGTMCYQNGVQTDSRLAFHFEPQSFTAYVACAPGKLIKLNSRGFEEVPNGTDGQLFIFPPKWQPLLTRPLDEIGGEIGTPSDFPKSDMCRRALFPDGFLVRHLFGGTSFEIRSMSEKQVRVLVMAYVMFLMMPGVVSERAMLQALGPTGSGKTFLLELFGHLLLGPTFMVRPLPEDVREFENQIINEYFAVYDNVSHVPAKIRDRFCQAVTGIEVVRRELYTTAQEARYQSKATLALSAITPPLPELEHQNRTVSINFKERTESGYIAKEELFKVVDRNRDDIILNLLRRMTLVLEAMEAQRDYVPKVNVRLSSIATFILRIARHEGWEDDAQKLLSAWAEEQTGYALQEDDVSTAITRWMGRADWKPNVELTATALNDLLRRAMGDTDEQNLNWRGNHLALAKMISRNLKIYSSRFGLERQDCTLRNSRGGYSYKFNPKPELLDGIKKDAAYEKQILSSNGQEDMF
jgi:hypothetical protein